MSANEWNRRISPLPHADTLRTGSNYLQQLICLMFGWGMLGVHSLAIGTRFVLSHAEPSYASASQHILIC